MGVCRLDAAEIAEHHLRRDIVVNTVVVNIVVVVVVVTIVVVNIVVVVVVVVNIVVVNIVVVVVVVVCSDKELRLSSNLLRRSSLWALEI